MLVLVHASPPSELSAIESNNTHSYYHIAISQKHSCTISADKTVIVARTLGACAIFFLVIATTTRLPWASFGATFANWQKFQSLSGLFVFTCLKDCSLICVKEILHFWSYMPGTPKKKTVNRELFYKFLQVSVLVNGVSGSFE